MYAKYEAQHTITELGMSGVCACPPSRDPVGAAPSPTSTADRSTSTSR